MTLFVRLHFRSALCGVVNTLNFRLPDGNAGDVCWRLLSVVMSVAVATPWVPSAVWMPTVIPVFINRSLSLALSRSLSH